VNIFFRVDASVDIGSGHVIRCKTLALNFISELGANVFFIMRQHDGHLGNLIKDEGYKVIFLPEVNKKSRNLSGYDLWLGIDWITDAEQTIEILKNYKCNMLIVDHYALDFKWEAMVRVYVDKISIIDDLANRKHECDYLIDVNHSVISKSNLYRSLVPNKCILMLGPRYAILRPEYRINKIRGLKSKKSIKRILVYVGASDNSNLTNKILRALDDDEFNGVHVEIVIGPNFLEKKSVIKAANLRPNFKIHQFLPHLADLMTKCDMSIGAGGGTLWERLYLELPSLVISTNENQEPACKSLSQIGLIKYLGADSDIGEEKIKIAIREMIKNYKKYLTQILSQSIIDGKGSDRIREELFQYKNKLLKLDLAALEDYETLKKSFKKINALIEHGNNTFHRDNYVDFLMQKEKKLLSIQFEKLQIALMMLKESHDFTEITYVIEKPFEAKDIPFKEVLDMLRSKDGLLSNYSNFIKLNKFHTNLINSGDLEKKYSIVILSDENSWINEYIVWLIDLWLHEGHTISWVHEVGSLKNADLCFYLSFSKIVSKKTRDLFKNNLVVHESHLPQGRGWSPLTWQIIEGKNSIPVSLIEADDLVDAGCIYAQEYIYFSGDELVDELREKQAISTIKLCQSFVRDYPNSINLAKQQVGTPSSYPRRDEGDSKLDANKTIAEQFNLLRVVDNEKYPAYFEMNGHKFILKIVKK
jgi:UDP-2,4-diacetamido-2,4,6-trideoxy-beta-L-altropyranose hydrolase